MKATIGFDLGNYDTKTQHTTTPSSYRASTTENKLVDENVFYNGMYYVPTRERNNQQIDKTVDNYCIYMSLFAIAKEIIWQIKDNYRKKHNGEEISREDLQTEISKVNQIILGIGLPVGHFSSLGQKTCDCFAEAFKNGLSFTYNGFQFNLKLAKKCLAYIQDFVSVAFNPALTIPQKYSSYYILGIGGGTADIIPVIYGEPQAESCKSLNYGSTVMYEYISTTIQHETGKDTDYSSIEAILNGDECIIDEARQRRVKELSAEFINRLINEFVHMGLKLSDYPCVFVGGGALLMRPVLEKSPLIAKAEFVEDVHANAKFYAEFANKM